MITITMTFRLLKIKAEELFRRVSRMPPQEASFFFHTGPARFLDPHPAIEVDGQLDQEAAPGLPLGVSLLDKLAGPGGQVLPRF